MEFMFYRFYCIVLALVLYACKGSGDTAAPGSGARVDNEIDLEWANKLGEEMYSKIGKGDSAVIYKLFEPALKEDFSDFMDILRSRESLWGQLHSWKIIGSSSYVSANDDTVRFEVTVTALYDDNESYDVLTIERIGDNEFKLTGYDFSTRFMYSCGLDALDELKPVYKKYAEAMVFGYKNKIRELSGTDSVFYDSLMNLSRSTFPEGTTLDSISFEDGYIRKYCGVNEEAKGVLAYKIYMNETEYQNVVFKLRRDDGEEEFEMYEVIFDGELLIDGTEDVELAKRISRDICKIIKENDYEKFFTTFHSELRALYTNDNKIELKEVVNDFASLGTFNDYYDWHIFRTKDNSFVYFIIVVELMNEEDYISYLEMAFKPDENGKFMLVSCHELTQ